jgi:6-phosphogluconate dehydrogenase
MSTKNMTAAPKEMGLIGLGNMGRNIAERMHYSDYFLILYDKMGKNYTPFRERSGVHLSDDMQDFAYWLEEAPTGSSIVWAMVPGGSITNNLMNELSGLLRSNDIVIDASNSDYTDSVANYNTLKNRGIYYLDVGCAGGPEDLLKGVSLMVGGDRVAFERAEDIFKVVAGSGTYGYLGGSGSGHMAKLVHNIVFYSIFPAYAEGIELLSNMGRDDINRRFDIIEALRLLASSPPITTGIMAAMVTAINKEQLPANAPQMNVSEMVRSGQKKAEKLGVSLSVTNAILEGYASMSENSRRIFAAAKQIITGH